MTLPEKENRAVKIGGALKRMRERRGLTQLELARRLGMKGSCSGQIGRWERGEYPPRFEAVWDCMDTIGASLEDFVDELVPRKRSPRLQEIAQELDSLARPSGWRGDSGRPRPSP